MEDRLPAFALCRIVRPFAGLPGWWTRRLFCGQRSLGGVTPQRGEGLLHLTVLVAVAGVLLFTRLSCPLLEPDETRYAEIPRQMLVHGSFIEPVWHGQPYYHKPPLLYWLVMACYSVFGVHDWAARLVPAAASLCTILVTYWWGRQAFGARQGLVGALILCLSARFVYLGRMLTMDALLCLWVAAALAAAHRAAHDARLRRSWWTLSAAAAGLGLLTKGPVALVLVLVPTALFQLLDQRAARPSLRAWLMYIALAVGIASPWYLAMAWTNPAAAGEFFWLHHVQRYLDPIDHEEPLWFFLPGLVLGTLPWSLLLIPLIRHPATERPAALGFVVLALVWCVSFFSLSGCKRAGYILPALPPLALACSCGWMRVCQGFHDVRRPMFRWWAGLAVVVLAVLWAGVYAWLPGYHRRFALRGQVRPHAEVFRRGPVLCYPKRWDSVTFYLQREDVQVFAAEQCDEMIARALANPQTLLFIKTRFMPKLPPGVEFVALGRQGSTLAVGVLRRCERQGGSSAAQLPAQHGDRLAAEVDAVAAHADAHQSAACRRLVAHQVALVEPFAPVRSQTAVGGAGHGILGDACARGEEARHEVIGGVVCPRRDDDATHRVQRQPGEVRPQRPDRLLALDLHQAIHAVFADEAGLHAEHGRQVVPRLARLRRPAREVHGHAALVAPHRQ
jgi:hypothetical protein